MLKTGALGLNYLSNLKRKNIFKLAVAYLALGWIFVQITKIGLVVFWKQANWSYIRRPNSEGN